jgi:hypothetical protein
VNLEDRLRAASRALKDASVAQVDAASRLREIVRHSGQPVAHGRTAVLPDGPEEAPEPVASFLLPPAQARRRPQRLALAVNLLLVLALGIVLGVAATSARDAGSTAPAPVPVASTVAVTRPASQPQVEEACLDAAELADEIIAKLNRNDRDTRLALALRDYTIASQSCRRAASP